MFKLSNCSISMEKKMLPYFEFCDINTSPKVWCSYKYLFNNNNPKSCCGSHILTGQLGQYIQNFLNAELKGMTYKEKPYELYKK